MPDEDYTAVGFILDKSGSMRSHMENAISGYNELLEEQKGICEELDSRVSLTRTIFDHVFPPEVEHWSDIREVGELDEDTYRPGGSTALLDAVGYTIDEMGRRFDKMDENEKPSNVVVAIITDGKENASQEYRKEQIKDMIEQQEDEWDWEFIFVGAGIDAFAEASGMGVASGKTMSSAKSSQGFAESYKATSKAIGQTQVTGGVGSDWKDVSTDDQINVDSLKKEESSTDDS